MASSSSEPNVRLDPLGIYGTRSARRRQQMQRRRQWQNALLWLLGVAALSGALWWLLQPHSPFSSAHWSVDLPFRPASPLVLAPDGALWLTSQSGGLWSLSPPRIRQGVPAQIAAPRRVFFTDFAPGAAPTWSQNSLFWPGADGVLQRLSASRGQVFWRRALPSTLVMRPALLHAAGREIVAAGDDEGHLEAFDASTGLSLWKRLLGGPAGEGAAVIEGAKPAFVVPMLAGRESRGGLVCLNAQNGALRWRFPADARTQSAGLVAPVADRNRVFWCTDEGSVIALDATTGRKIWKNFAAPLAKSASISPLTTAPRLKEVADLVTLRGAPVVAKVSNLVVVGGNDGVLRAFDWSSGAARWHVSVGSATRFAPQVVRTQNREALLVSGDEGGIFLIDCAQGRVLQRWKTPYGADLGLVVTPDMALVLDTEGHLQGAPLH